MSAKYDRRDFLLSAGAVSIGPLILSNDTQAGQFEPSLKATVEVGPEPLHALPRSQYGHFIEHLGKCIKGGIWAEGERPDMFLGGVRQELLEAVKSINPSLIRYPGGCFADGYHWQDGIGPRSERPMRKNRAWAKLGKKMGPREDNHFGTDEFLRLCREVGAEPQLTANVGSGTAQEAAEWVEYCNGPVSSKWGAERARNGHAEPYNVKHWFIGNEIFGPHEIGHQSPQEYVGTLHEYAQVMQRVDPDIKLIACGTLFPKGIMDDINSTVLKGAGNVIDYLSVHWYASGPVFPSSLLKYQVLQQHRGRSTKVYYDIMATLQGQEKFLARCIKDVRTYAPAGKKIPLSFDEWNLWYAGYSDLVQSNFNLRDGLWVASTLNMLHRLADDIELANISQMVNCVGIINSSEQGTFLTPSALVYKIYTEHAGDELLPSKVDSPALPHKSGLAALDISATRTDGTVCLLMVNRHLNSELVVETKLKGSKITGSTKRIELYHPDAFLYNTCEKPKEVKVTERDENLSIDRHGTTSSFTVRLAPHSLTCLKLNVEEI